MSDELAAVTAEEFFAPEEPTPEPTEASEVPAEQPAPEPAPDLAAKEAELKRKEAELNKWNMKIAEREKALSATQTQVKPSEKDEKLSPLSDEAAEVLDAWFQQKYGEKLSAVDILFQDTIESELEAFATAKGVDPETLRDTLSDSGIQPREFSRKGLREAFTTAHDIIRARSVDLNAERAKWEEEFMAKLKEQGIRVDSVEPSGRVDMDVDSADVMDDDDLSPADKYNAIVARLKKG